MNKMISQVADFHRAFDHPLSEELTLYPVEDSAALAELRIKLIREELDEFSQALWNDDIVEVADAVADLLYVVIGAGLAYGIPIEACFNEVHESNMTKLGPDGKPLLNGVNCPLDPTKPVGKVLKGPKYREPNIRKILFPDG